MTDPSRETVSVSLTNITIIIIIIITVTTIRSCGAGQLDIRTPEAELDVEQQRQLPQGRQARQPALHHVRGRGVRPLRLRQHHQGEDQGDLSHSQYRVIQIYRVSQKSVAFIKMVLIPLESIGN